MASENRFLGSANDPRFWTMPKKARTVKIDERFASMFTDKRFSVEATMDKFGNPIVERESRAVKDLQRIYQLEGKSSVRNFLEDEDSDSESDEDEMLGEKEKDRKTEVKEKEKNDTKAEGEENEPPRVPAKDSESSMSEDVDEFGMFKYKPDSDTDSSEIEDVDRLEQLAREISPEPEEINTTAEPSRKFGIVQMTWRNIKALDLLVVLRGVCPPSGEVKRVAIHYTKEGYEEQLRELREGPRIEIHTSGGIKDYDTLALARVEALNNREVRKHEKAVLGWNYAYVECDSKETAHSIYKQLDGINFMATGDLFDIRFMDDDFEPPEDQPLRDEAMDIPPDYEPPCRWEDQAGTHSTPLLTFDKEDLKRKSILSRAPIDGEPLDYNKFTPYLSEHNVDAGYNTEEVVEASDSEGEKVYLKRRARKRYLPLLEELPQPLEDDFEETGVTFHSALSETGQKLLKEQSNMLDETREDAKKRIKREKRNLRRQKKRDWVRLKNLNIHAMQPAAEKSDVAPSNSVEPVTSIHKPESESESVMKKKKKRKKPNHEDKISDYKQEQHGEPGKKMEKKKRGRKREREKQNKELAELSLLTMGKEENEGFNLNQLVKSNKKNSKKRKKSKEIIPEDKFQIDHSDDRFKSLYANPDYYLDPNDPKFHKTAQMEKVLQRTRESRQEMLESVSKVPGRPKVASSASFLAKRLKEKNRKFKRKKKRV